MPRYDHRVRGKLTDPGALRLRYYRTMRYHAIWSLPALLASCEARISDTPIDAIDAIVADAIAIDAAPDGPPKLGAWTTPARIPQASSASNEDDVTLSSNALEMIFAISGTNGKDLFFTSRLSLTDPWEPALGLPVNTTGASEESPRFSGDDKTLYFASDRDGNLDIYKVTRSSTGWGAVSPLSEVNTTKLVEKWFMPCGTNQYVVVQSAVAGGSTDLLEGTLGGGDATPITALNTDDNETGAFLTQDCLTIYFGSDRTGMSVIYTSHRSAITSAWPGPTPVIDFVIPGGNGAQEDPWLSADGHTFAFASNADGDRDIFISTR
jgi:Tol biopolymer transport system component